MKSLDPRVERLNISEDGGVFHLQKNPDQFVTFEVFLQKKPGMSFDHVGIVHAPDENLALILAKEQFSRRSTCSGLLVADTRKVLVSPYTDLEEDVYEQTGIEISGAFEKNEELEVGYSIFHLTKRGKQHKHMGSLSAKSYGEAFKKAKTLYKEEKPVLNVWIIRDKDIFGISEHDSDIWNTLPDKSHRDVTSYRAKDKIDRFKSEQLNK